MCWDPQDCLDYPQFVRRTADLHQEDTKCDYQGRGTWWKSWGDWMQGCKSLLQVESLGM